MIRIFKTLIGSIEALNKNIETLISKHEETHKIQVEQKRLMDSFVFTLTSFFDFEKRQGLKKEKREEEEKIARTYTEDDLRF